MNPQNSPTSTATPGSSGSGSGTLTDARQSLGQTARETASKVKQAASSTAARVKDEADHYASQQKETAAGKISSYSSAIHETAQSLEEKDPNIAWFAHRAADRLDHVAGYIRNRDFGALRRDAEDLARRHPAVFFGGMFLAGLLLGNVVKASQRKLYESQDYDEGDSASDWMQSPQSDTSDPNLSAEERTSAGL